MDKWKYPLLSKNAKIFLTTQKRQKLFELGTFPVGKGIAWLTDCHLLIELHNKAFNMPPQT